MLKILLADDSMTAQNMGKKILTDAGYDVVAVSNGAAAVKKLPEVNPDIVLVDIYMPGYNGLEVCEQIKSNPQTAHIPVLLTVGKLEPFQPEEGMRVKAQGVVIKPFEATDLLTVVNRLAELVPAPATVHAPVQTVSIPTTAVIPDYSFGEVEAEPEHESRIEVPWEAASIPAFGDDLLPAPQAEVPNAQPFQTPDKPVSSAGFGDFEIELEPLPVEPATAAGNASSLKEDAFSAQSAAAFPIEFEIDETAAPQPGAEPQPLTTEQVLEFVPFVPEAPSPDQARSEARFEAAMAAFDTAPQYAEVQQVSEQAAVASAGAQGMPPDEVTGSIPSVQLDSDSDTEVVDHLSCVLREALASVEGAPVVEHHEEGFATEYELDVATAAESVATSALPHAAPAPSLQQFPGAATPDSTGTIIDLDDLLAAPSTPAPPDPVVDQQSAPPEPSWADALAHEARATVAPSSVTAVDFYGTQEAPSAAMHGTEAEMIPQEVEPSLPSPAPDSVQDNFDVNHAIAEQIAERVLQRLRPQLIEEIRNVLKEM